MLLLAAAFGGGLWIASRDGDAGLEVAARYGAAWERGDWNAMHRLLAPEVRDRLPSSRFAELHQEALATATVTRVRAGVPVALPEDRVGLPLAVETRGFGTVRSRIELDLDTSGDEPAVLWERTLRFPGLRDGEELAREIRMPPRAALLWRDGTVLAEGEDRGGAADPVLARSIAGQLGPVPEERRGDLEARGVPGTTLVGVSGLERVFDERLLGRPGGELRAGDRLLARREPSPGRAVRTTLDRDTQRAAIEGLGARLGGIAALRPSTGEVLALAGIAFSGLQPPGSTFKIITLAAALEEGVAKPSDRFPVQTETSIAGVTIQNADGESCGGTLTYSFAHSCNSVFAPMGAELGAERLVAAAERFGFNQDLGIPGAAMSTIPKADEIGDDLAVGASAIGQGRVQATALQIALVAATIARGGVRPLPILDRDVVAEAGGAASRGPRVVSAKTASSVTKMMREVVRSGTGQAAAIPGGGVAGKTGTAELRTTQTDCTPQPAPAPPCPELDASDTSDTSAWFSAFAPAGKPRVAVGVLLVASGQGGDTAAPVARQVLRSALY